jgi:hypothetical protein
MTVKTLTQHALIILTVDRSMYPINHTGRNIDSLHDAVDIDSQIIYFAIMNVLESFGKQVRLHICLPW